MPEHTNIILVGAFLLAQLATGLAASRKGYNLFIWLFAASLIGLTVLAFLPFANRVNEPQARNTELRRIGNAVGAVFACVAMLATAFRFIVLA